MTMYNEHLNIVPVLSEGFGVFFKPVFMMQVLKITATLRAFKVICLLVNNLCGFSGSIYYFINNNMNTIMIIWHHHFCNTAIVQRIPRTSRLKYLQK